MSESAIDIDPKYSTELSFQMALRQRQFAALSNFILVSSKIPSLSGEIVRTATKSINSASEQVKLKKFFEPAIATMAEIQSKKIIEDSIRLSIASAVVLVHSIFEDLLHSSADISFRANPAWWDDRVYEFSKEKFSLREIAEKGVDKLIESERALFISRWQRKSLINKLDSFLRVHKPITTKFGKSAVLNRDAIVAIDSLRHKIVHEDIFTEPEDEILNHVYRTIDSGRFIHRLLAEPHFLGLDAAALVASTPIMTGISHEVMNLAASKITPDSMKIALDEMAAENEK